MRDPIDFSTKRNRRHAQLYRQAQAQTMLDRFKASRGRPPETTQELGRFLEEEQHLGRLPAGPIQPTPEAIAKVEAAQKDRR